MKVSVSSPIVNSPILAHRGASAFAPENTIEAVELAARMGATWIETDVQLTADGKLVMIHDKRLERTTNGKGYVAKHNLSDIQSLDAGGWFADRFRGLRPPTLGEFVECIISNGLNLQLELKETSGREHELVDAVCDALKRIWPFDERSLFLSGFSERCLRRAAERMPHIPRALTTVYVPQDPDGLAEEIGVQIMHVQDEFTDADAIRTIRQSSVEFAVATVNDRERAQELLDAGVQSILTDNPRILQAETAILEGS